ncbi:MAG TPA: zinc-dependent metalloprotease [Gemmataceae bacterium]|nr:zinc-dependent metalloprotease [Gemmataceae bacterium]
MSHPPNRLRALLLAAAVIGATTLAPWAGRADDESPLADVMKERAKKPGALKKYGEVIPPDKARTSQGLFTVHRVEDKVYYEIPADAYGKLMLWNTEIAKAPAGVSFGGAALGHHTLRWERRDNKVYLWEVSFEKHGDGKAVQRAVDSATMGSIVMSFPVEAEGRDRAAVIDATPLLAGDVAEFSARRLAGGGAGIDSGRSYVEEIKAFPTNIETRSLLTFRAGGGGGSILGVPIPGGGGPGRSVSVLLHHSMTLLPEKPMRGRYFDPRVGYFVQPFEDYATPKNWVVNSRYISRFRLEKKDPKAEVSEPVKPITFYVSREVPEKWRESIKKGVEDWQPAFEKAGFKNAIICKYAPSVEDDPSWDPEDARYSVIRWVALPVMNAMGPHVHDPRSGEIVSAHIIMWHDVLKLVQQWYFVQCGALDPQARQLPLPDEVTGKLLRMVVTHEVGHTLGLRHNHKASSAYTVAQLRDPKFTEEHGTTASIMSYGRFNYVAQPEDKVTWLIPKLGPYDEFAIAWGYKPIAAASSEGERAELDKWAARQMDEPWLRFGGEDGPAVVDPSVKTENIGADPLEATALGLKNLDRVTDLLIPATTRLGDDDTLLKEAYQALMTHRANWFRSVAAMVGGVVETRSLGGRGTDCFTRVPKEQQRAAVRFLTENAFSTPGKLLQPALVNRFKYFGVADDVMAQQKSLLVNLLSGRRFHQMMDAEVLAPDKSYTAMEFLGDVQNGVWSELQVSQPTIGVCRRQLQRAYLEHLKNELNPKEATGGRVAFPADEDMRVYTAGSRDTDFRAVARAALHTLAERLDRAIPQARDGMTRAHLEDCRREVELILNPKN